MSYFLAQQQMRKWVEAAAEYHPGVPLGTGMARVADSVLSSRLVEMLQIPRHERARRYRDETA